MAKHWDRCVPSGIATADGLDAAIECEAEDRGLRIIRAGLDVGSGTLDSVINQLKAHSEVSL